MLKSQGFRRVSFLMHSTKHVFVMLICFISLGYCSAITHSRHILYTLTAHTYYHTPDLILLSPHACLIGPIFRPSPGTYTASADTTAWVRAPTTTTVSMYIQHRCLNRSGTAGLGSGGMGGPTMEGSSYNEVRLFIPFILSYDIYSILEHMCELNKRVLLSACLPF